MMYFQVLSMNVVTSTCIFHVREPRSRYRLMPVTMAFDHNLFRLSSYRVVNVAQDWPGSGHETLTGWLILQWMRSRLAACVGDSVDFCCYIPRMEKAAGRRHVEIAPEGGERRGEARSTGIFRIRNHRIRRPRATLVAREVHWSIRKVGSWTVCFAATSISGRLGSYRWGVEGGTPCCPLSIK